MKKIKILFLLPIILFAACKINAPELEYQAKGASAIETEIHNLVNQHRVSIGKSPLLFNSYMMEICREHSYNMANGITPFGHYGFADRVSRIRAAIGGGAAAENVAYGYTTAASVVQGWLDSPGHRTNIEGDYTTTGIGVVKSPGGSLYFTQIFLNK